ncbi:NACHT domain-containing protein [Actinokineospora terrae]|uniref:NACHT domain-containing protein n=1 Tax=Actinokineospora terrae TaxID=155974 RepID=A0A1H9SJZ9_9PSEU|nr:NACHT domain-containing protein [Actinokineospora terrae]SER85302.1 NACHT domain-containing protein [Actinokineospora terrae]
MSVFAAAMVVLGTGTGVVALLERRRRSRPVPEPELTADQRFEQEYIARVRRGARYVDLKGLQTLSHSSLELDEVYVDVSLVHRPPHQVRTDVLAGLPTTVQGRRPLAHFLDDPRPQVLTVLGGPGSGKTTLLRKTARDICDSGTPVLLFLRDHLAEILRGASLPEIVVANLARYDLVDADQWVARKLRSDRCVVMLDGLDEVARAQDRRSVSAWVENQITAFSGNDFVLTSRPQGFLDAPVDGTVVLQVRPFTPAQVRDFVHGWYRAVANTVTPDAHDRAAEEAQDLLARLDEAPALVDLTVNPLLLTMIATVHQFRGALPGSRADLYREICEVMLWHRDEAKKLVSTGNNRHKMVLLRSLAYLMMTNGVRQLAREVVLAEFERLLRRLSTPLDAEAHLRRVISDGLVVEWERDQFAFAHLTFQEYLAAAYIREKNLVDTLCYAVDDDWWRETTLLYVAGSDADPIVLACLASRTSTALGLALDCVAEGVELDEKLRSELDGVLRDAANDPALREKVLQAMLSRHLRSAVRTATGSVVWRTPVPAGLYRLLDDSPAVEGQGDEPARGMSSTSAVQFVDELNKSTVFPVSLRLATASELNHPSVLPTIQSAAAWTKEPFFTTAQLWMNASFRPRVATANLRHEAQADLTPATIVLLLKRIPAPTPRMIDLISHLTDAIDSAEEDPIVLAVTTDLRRGPGAERIRARFGNALMDSVRAAMDQPQDLFLSAVREQFTSRAGLIESDIEPIGEIADLCLRLHAAGADQPIGSRLPHHHLTNMVAEWNQTASLTGKSAAQIRFLALSLSAEARPESRRVFVQLAATATMWDWWRTGKVARPQVVILAADAPESLSARPPR